MPAKKKATRKKPACSEWIIVRETHDRRREYLMALWPFAVWSPDQKTAKTFAWEQTARMQLLGMADEAKVIPASPVSA